VQPRAVQCRSLALTALRCAVVIWSDKVSRLWTCPNASRRTRLIRASHSVASMQARVCGPLHAPVATCSSTTTGCSG